MSTTLPAAPENADQFGRFSIVTREMNDEGTIVGVHRAPVAPGQWVDGVWAPTDVASLPAEVQPFATALWTDTAVERFKTAFPWSPPAPPPPSVVRIETLWRRATDAEATAIETAVAGLSVRLRNVFAAATALTEGDELTEALRAALTAALGADRAAELLSGD